MKLRLSSLFLVLAACNESSGPPPTLTVVLTAGNAQTDTVGHALATPYAVTVADLSGAPLAGVAVAWSATLGGGSVAPDTSFTNASGVATAVRTLGTIVGSHQAQALVAGAAGPVTFSATAVNDSPASLFIVSGAGLVGNAGQAAPAPYVVRVRDQFNNAVPGVAVQWTVQPGQGTLSAALDTSDGAGQSSVLHTLGAVPGLDTARASASGLVPVTFATGALLAPTVVATVPVAANYGLHDTFVRDGIAFLCAWNTGIWIYDVGHGIAGGSVGSPRVVSQIVTGPSGLGGAFAHNAWWFHNPNTAEMKYLFVGQEGPGAAGGSASGDIHVVDVSDLANPVEVASYRMAGAGVHNFWMDEQAEVLFAAYYNGGVVALDVSDTLTGNLASRELARFQPGGAGNTFTWGVMQSGGSIYAADMLSGFWQLNFTGSAFTTAAGGNNVQERYSSDLWVTATHAYTGTWGGAPRGGVAGNALKIWRLGVTGAPQLIDSLLVSGVTTISDLQVSDDGRLLVLSAEGGTQGGVYVYGLANPEKPLLLGRHLISTGVHTVTVATQGGRRYAFAAKNPGSPALVILDITNHAP